MPKYKNNEYAKIKRVSLELSGTGLKKQGLD